MNFSPRQGARKWLGRGKMVTAVAVLALVFALPSPGQARGHAGFSLGELFGPPPRSHRPARTAKIPLPRPRPAEAPAREEAEQAKGEPEIPPATEAPGKPADHQPAEQTPAEPPAAAAPAAPPPPQLSACRQALTEEIAVAPSIPSVHGPGGCGGEDLVRLEAIVLPDKRRVAVTPPATLRCAMASEVADWVRSDIAPMTQKLGSEITSLDNFDSFECRGRNRVKGAPLSEHGKANALDVRGFKLANGRDIGLADRSEPRSLREDVLHSVCTRFMTVLGPDSDWYHEDHIHLDLADRRNNYRICEWDVLDPLPKVAPLMPEERPADAPPREVAKQEGRKGEGANEEGAKEEGAKEAPAAEGDQQDEAKPAEAPPSQEQHPKSKPHRSAKASSKPKHE